jgi:hypothetical protein
MIRELYENPELGFVSQKLRFKTGSHLKSLKAMPKVNR